MGVQVAIITGEASGDRVGGQLAEEIRGLAPDAALWGSGGRYMARAGVEVLWDSGRWGGIGAAAVLKILPRLLLVRAAVRRELLRRRPEALVAVDAGWFNVALCAWAKRRLPAMPILYYFPPGSWRRTLKGSSLGPITDVVATPFPWSESELRRLGVNAIFTGHPLLDLVHPSEPAAAFAERQGIDRDRPVVGLLPGSRQQEIHTILPAQLEAATIIHRRVPGVQFLLGLAPTVDRADIVRAVESLRRKHAHLHPLLNRMEERLRAELSGTRLPPLVTTEGTLVPPDDLSRLKAPVRRVENARGDARDLALTIVEDATYDMMAASDVLLTTSGTATLEAAILGKPMVIVYKMSWLNLPEYWLIRKKLPPHIGMPNLLADRRICPELLQDDATPENLSREIIALLLEPERLLRMKEDLKGAVGLLGQPGGARRTAQTVIDLAKNGRGRGTENRT